MRSPEAAWAAASSSSRRGCSQCTLMPLARRPAMTASSIPPTPTITAGRRWGRGNVVSSGPRAGDQRRSRVSRTCSRAAWRSAARGDRLADGVHLGGPSGAGCGAGPDAEVEAAPGDGVDAGGGERQHGRRAVVDVGDHRAELDRLGRRGERTEQRERLEHVIATDRDAGEVVEDPHGAEAGRFCRLGTCLERRPVEGALVELDVEDQAGDSAIRSVRSVRWSACGRRRSSGPSRVSRLRKL